MSFDEQLACELLNTSKVTIVKTVKISHVGWESDTEAWLVKTAEGTTHAMTTNHGKLYLMQATELPRQREYLLKQIADIEDALLMLKASK